MVTSEDIVVEVREWINTPYRHQYSVKSVGCDCLGLIRGVYEQCIGPEPETPPNYTPSWGEASGRELMLEASARHLVTVDEMISGDVLVFRMRKGSVAKHCGILVEPDRMVHAYQSVQMVTENYFNDYWRDRVVGIFRYPGVE